MEEFPPYRSASLEKADNTVFSENDDKSLGDEASNITMEFWIATSCPSLQI
ncbi:hypothetical protein Ddye_022223 [Dipteronia dyeriana]|uniref:Uncharacterized protein n=1 Tax=Dipteronia dyeriana TaxID=168575 RepID=A0AAD9WY95_9ROSI|nr:hypothetical protein Ddye_022223 [Dipteronia dyeriana]